MKKSLKFAAFAVVAMALTVACKSNADNEENTAEDTIVPETMDSIDTLACQTTEDTLVVEEPVKSTAKATTKKAEDKMTVSKDANVDANANAKGRLAKKEAEKSGLKEAAPTKNNESVDMQKNAENRLGRR